MANKYLRFRALIVIAAVAVAGIFIYQKAAKYFHENEVLKQVVSRLEADSRLAQVLVTGVNFNEASGKNFTTIKFLEFDSDGRTLGPKYFTFSGNIIQFQSLVVRFDDAYVRRGDKLRGKSAYLFWKVFMLDGKNTQEFDITPVNQIPQGYKVQGLDDPFESKLWERFWSYALNPDQRVKVGVKNAQIEAPGTMFLPGIVYTIKIEHDGGMRIDSQAVPQILRGEKIP